MLTKNSTRTRRIAARIALASGIALVPVAAVAVPAFAATPDGTPSAVAIDWNNHDHGGDWNNRDHGGDRNDHRDHGDNPWQQAPWQQALPSTGSAGY